MQKMCNTESEGKAYIFFMLTVFPLFVLNGYSNITLTKCIVFIALTVFFVVCLGVNYIMAFTNGKRPQISVKKGFSSLYLPDWLLLLMLIFTIISCIISPYIKTKNSLGQSLLFMGAGRFDGLLFAAIYMIIFWLCARHGKFGQWFTVLLALTTTIMGVISIFQLGGTNLFGLYPKSSYNGHYNQFISTIGNVDMMAGFLSMAWPLIWMGYILFPFDSNGDVEKLPQFVKNAGAKDIIKAYFVFEKLIRYFLLPAIFLMIYVGLKIEVEMFKVVFVVIPMVLIPFVLRSAKKLCRLLQSLSVIVLAVGMSDAVTYTYVSSEQRTKTEFSFTTILWICLLVAYICLMASILTNLNLSNKAKRKKSKNKRIEKEKRTNPWNYVTVGIVALELLGIAGVFCFFRFIYEPTVQSGMMYDLYELSRGHLTDTAGSHRGAIWKYSLKMSKENLIFGTGTGTFATSFKQFTKEVGYNYYQDKNLDFAHNEYINLLCTGGLTGLLSYLGFLISSAYLSVKSMAKNPKVLVLFGAVLGYAVQAFFSFSVVIMTPLFWVFMGLLVKEARETLYK